LYGGVGYTLMSGGPAFLTILAGLAIHNGPLTRPRQSCGGNRSDCGLGAPLLLHLGMEIGYRLSRRWAATAIYHHMSHNQRLAEENENIDSLGLRLQFSF
ncbi:MAG: acyloxyacyl hydrolase, partial [Ectothiorhodospiraceae bacterium]